MSAPQRSKRDRGRERMGLPAKQAERRICELCGAVFFSAGAHAEECRGAPADTALREVAAHPHVCQARRPAAFGLYSHCVLPFRHSGEHHWSDEPSSRMGGGEAA